MNILKTTFQIFPFFLIFIFHAGLFYSETQQVTLWLLEENKPVEMLTFLFFMLGGVIALCLVAAMARQKHPIPHILLVFGFGLMLFIVGMEEVAWGQQLFGFETPELIKAINYQNELTLHNIKGLHSRTEWFRLVFGLGGLFGIMAVRIERLRSLSVPTIFFTWFLVISAHAFIDLVADYVAIPTNIDRALSETAELIEMMIGFAAMLYIWLKMQELTDAEQGETPAMKKTP